MILMIDNYDSFTFNIFQYFKELEQKIKVFRNDQISLKTISRLSFDALIISPGPRTPDKTGCSNDAIKFAIKNRIPVFGICLGLQCIGKIFGSTIIHAPNPVHGKTSKIYHNGKNIFSNIPSPFKATRYHSLILAPKSIPKTIEVTAKTKDNIIMAIQHKTLPIYGVQFHPESALSEYGHQILKNFLNLI